MAYAGHFVKEDPWISALREQCKEDKGFWNDRLEAEFEREVEKKAALWPS